MTKLTVADILERKNIIKPLKLTYNSEILGGEIEIKKLMPTRLWLSHKICRITNIKLFAN